MAITVEDIMSRPAIFIDPEATVAHAATLMRRRGIHSLVISLPDDEYGIVTTTDGRGMIVGMISAIDIFMAVEESGWESRP